MTDNKTSQKEKRNNYSISLTRSEQEEMVKFAENLGLSLSAFLRLAAKDYMDIKENK